RAATRAGTLQSAPSRWSRYSGSSSLREREPVKHTSTKRRRAREYALQLLFQYEYLGSQVDLDLFWKDKEEEQEVRDFTTSIVRGTLKKMEDIDREIVSCTDNWALDRLAAVDRSVLRAAAYEILFRDDIPHAVTINEALEIVKKYSTTESASFINGVLDKLAKKNLRERHKAE
ncbi:transcription antitermination factor NusB, partial [Nitrospirota bacterium]